MVDKDIKDDEEIFKEATDEARETEKGSVLSKREMFDVVRRKFKVFGEKEEVVDQYNAGNLSRRDFLKVIGVVTAGGIIGGNLSRMVFHDPDLAGYVTPTGVVTLSASAGSDISSEINSKQGQNIVVPGEEYKVANPIQLNAGTQLTFDDSTLQAAKKAYNIFNTSGQGWQVGGGATIKQGGSYPKLNLTGSGSFGDDQGRIEFKGVFLEKFELDMWLQAAGSGGDTIALNNVTQLEGPPKNTCNGDTLHWSNQPITLKLQGCALGNFHNNGFYAKSMTGRLEFYDCYMPSNNVAAVRNGVNKGVTMKRCLVVNGNNNNPGSGRNLSNPCAGVNHSMMAFQDKTHPTGDVLLEKVYYMEESSHAGVFLRAGMMDNDGSTPAKVTVTVKDCRWDSYPDYGMGANKRHITINEEGDNGKDTSEAQKQAYPFGGGLANAPDTAGGSSGSDSGSSSSSGKSGTC